MGVEAVSYSHVADVMLAPSKYGTAVEKEDHHELITLLDRESKDNVFSQRTVFLLLSKAIRLSSNLKSLEDQSTAE
jgi:hypothetical protein